MTWIIEAESASYGDLLDIDRIGERHWQAQAGSMRVEGSRLVFVLIGAELALGRRLPSVLEAQTTLLGRALERHTKGAP